jgi:uncharacterized cupredoxin-like copper-binding protein
VGWFDSTPATTLGWNFSETDQFTIACLVSDRYEAGMKGMVIVEP